MCLCPCTCAHMSMSHTARLLSVGTYIHVAIETLCPLQAPALTCTLPHLVLLFSYTPVQTAPLQSAGTCTDMTPALLASEWTCAHMLTAPVSPLSEGSCMNMPTASLECADTCIHMPTVILCSAGTSTVKPPAILSTVHLSPHTQ